MSITQQVAADDNGQFRPIGVQEPTPLYRDRPAASESHLTFTDPDGFQCFVNEEALGHMAAWGRRAGQNEVIGCLGGRFCTDGQGPYVLVERATLNRRAQGGAAYVDADIEAQDYGRREFDRRCPAFDRAGWWHSHPLGGLYYSHTDKENQETWTHPNAIGIVVNPAQDGERLKVFRGPDSRELELTSTTKAFRLPREKSTPTRLKDRAVPKVRDHNRSVPFVESETHHTHDRERRQNRIFEGLAAAISLAAAALLFAAIGVLFIVVSAHVFVWFELDAIPVSRTPPRQVAPAHTVSSDGSEPPTPLPAGQKPEESISMAPDAHNPRGMPKSFEDLPFVPSRSITKSVVDTKPPAQAESVPATTQGADTQQIEPTRHVRSEPVPPPRPRAFSTREQRTDAPGRVSPMRHEDEAPGDVPSTAPAPRTTDSPALDGESDEPDEGNEP